MWVHRSVRWTDLVADEVEYGFIKAVDLAASDHSLARCAAPLARNYCTWLLGCLERRRKMRALLITGMLFLLSTDVYSQEITPATQ